MSVMETIQNGFASLAAKTSAAAGSVWAFTVAVLTIVVWAMMGPVFGFSENWQLLINTGTTIVTFLMVFIIQQAQNREMRAVQVKLSELIAAHVGASNRLIDVEGLSDTELELLYKRYQRLAETAGRLTAGAKTSVDDAVGEEDRSR